MSTGVSGRHLLIKYAATAGSPATYTTIAALRDTKIIQTEQSVDTTSKDDSGKKSLLSGNILLSMTVSGTGVFTNAAVVATIRAAMRAGTHGSYKIYVAATEAAAAGGNYTGAFRINSFEESGSYNGEMNYTISLESDGAIAFATT